MEIRITPLCYFEVKNLIRENPLKKSLGSGNLAFGLYSDLLDPVLVEIMGKAGMHFVILDTEHNGFGIEKCRECILASEVAGITPLVRVYDNNPRLINKALEIGALGVVVPHVDTVEKALLAVRATKYPPEGIRGVHPGTRAAGFASSPDEWDKTWKSANQEIITVLQPLESLDGISNLEKIVQIPGLDLVSLGIGDLSQVLGCPMRPDDDRVREIHAKALDTCKKFGTPAYALVSTVEDAKKWHRQGVNVFIFGSDTGLFQRSVDLLVEDLHQNFPLK